MTETIGQRLRTARTNAGLSVGQAAKHSGIPADRIAAAETMASYTRADDVAPLADIYGVSPDWILTGRPAANRDEVYAKLRASNVEPADIVAIMTLIDSMPGPRKGETP